MKKHLRCKIVVNNETDKISVALFDLLHGIAPRKDEKIVQCQKNMNKSEETHSKQ